MLVEVDTNIEYDFGAMEDRLRDLITEAKKDERTVARCVITNFGTPSVEFQCSILRGTRAARDGSVDFKVQTVVSGVWNLFRVQEHWKKNHDEISPVPDQKHVFFQGRPKQKDIINQLSEARLIPASPAYSDRVCAEMLMEFTGGDQSILDHIIDSLKTQGQGLDAFESALSQATESGELADVIKKRATLLSPASWKVLTSVLNNQFVSRKERDVDIEDLRLMGFVKTQLVGKQKLISIGAPFVERILRYQWNCIAGKKTLFYQGRDMAQISLALNTAAYHLTAKIENILRNVIVLSFDDWTKELENVHVLSLGNAVTNSETTRVGGDGPTPAAQIAIQSEGTPCEFAKKAQKVSVIESAKNWQNRQKQNTAVYKEEESLIYFLTTGDLKAILENIKIYNNVVKSIFPEKAELSTFLQQYLAIRSAVAHNQPISLMTLKRLETSCADLEKRIYLAESQS